MNNSKKDMNEAMHETLKHLKEQAQAVAPYVKSATQAIIHGGVYCIQAVAECFTDSQPASEPDLIGVFWVPYMEYADYLRHACNTCKTLPGLVRITSPEDLESDTPIYMTPNGQGVDYLTFEYWLQYGMDLRNDTAADIERVLQEHLNRVLRQCGLPPMLLSVSIRTAFRSLRIKMVAFNKDARANKLMKQMLRGGR